MPDTFDIVAAREKFPGLKRSQVYLDNAGGSQILGDVASS
jgi:selenocysteine lyase/cysteine desulfurase